MTKNPRKQLNDRLRDLYIFEKRFIKGETLKEIAEFYNLSKTSIARIATLHRKRYEHSYNIIRKRIFKLPPIEITLLMMENPDILRATESWIKLHQAMIFYFLEQAYPGKDL